MNRRHFILLAALTTLSACALGANAENWDVAKGPAGATVDVTTRSAKIKAELIEVGDEGVVLRRSDGKLLFARYSVIDNIIAPRQGSAYKAGRKMPPSPSARANLKLISHFPHGITPEIRATLLAASGQSDFMVIE